MSKPAYIGALASLLLLCAPARADWRTPIAGAPPILPARFLPREAKIVATLPSAPAAAAELSDAESDAPIAWIAPLVDRRLTAAERTADLAPELQDAIMRIEPMYDPTRIYGAATPVRMSVSAGTAAMDSVFADRWQRADPDANVNQRVRYIALAWHRRGPLACDAFMKNRPRAGYEQPALTELSRVDCALLARVQTQGFDEEPPAPIVVGWIAVPAFAAPMPGSRMSSDAFWAARRADIARVEAELRLRQVWHGGMQGITASLARP